MKRKELIKKYIDFFKLKKHKEIPNFSLVPENDSSVLYTTAGMHPLIPYLLGQKHPLGERLCNVQRCLRTQDIDKIGDEVHHTFFEMLGNWSLGNYWKKEAIKYSFEFLTKILKISKEKLAVTCFKGNKYIPKDEESKKIWESLGIRKERIKFLGEKENFWIAGETGPCGPDAEIFFWTSRRKPPKEFNPGDKNWVEIWNNVFMEYEKQKNGNFIKLKQKNVDTGMGVERTLAALSNLEDDYLTECFFPIIKKIETLSGKRYKENKEETKAMRILADHIKASIFIINDGVLPSNTEQGYVLRRLIRRAVRYAYKLGIKKITEIAEPIFEIYDDYNLKKNKEKIISELEREEKKFLKTLEKGLNRFKKLASQKKKLSGKDAFLLYQSFGFPVEMIEEEAKKAQIFFRREDFEREKEGHRVLSRTAAKGKFKSGLVGNNMEVTKLHTATHLLNQALREVLKKDIFQRGSNINEERLRFDFSFDRKLTPEEIKKIEEIVNEKIKENLPVECKEMNLEEAKKVAKGVFDEKYKSLEKIKVYFIGDFSKEICAGPHVKRTGELGEGGRKFKILKEESSSFGVRRIKAALV